MTKKKVEPKQLPEPVKVPKYEIDIRCHEGHSDVCVLKTDSFREALEKFNELKIKLADLQYACNFDIIAWYVWNDMGCHPEYIPVVMCSVETSVVEW